MVFKLVRTDTVEPCKIKLPIGTHLVGRGKFLDCDDKRVSRNHGELLVTDDTITIKSLHQNPCFYMKCGSDETQILMQNCTVDLNNGDKFGLLPDTYWYEVLLCVLSDSPEPNVKEDQQEDVKYYSDSDDTEMTKHSSDTVVNNVASQENTTQYDDPSIDTIPCETSENIGRSESPSLLHSEEPLDQKNEPLAAPNGVTEKQDSDRKRMHSPTPDSDEVKKVKIEPCETVVKQEPENSQPGPSNAQANPQNPNDPDKQGGKDQGKPPTNAAQEPLRERCVYGAGCYSMPYKVVQTIENDKTCLSIIPSNWENEGTMSWPPRSEASSMLDENSVPGKKWCTFPCIVKRTCKTYKAALQEVREMENMTDTEEELPTEDIQLTQEKDVIYDFNKFMQVDGASTSIVTPSTNNAMADQFSLNDVNTSFIQKNDSDEMLKSQAKILEILEDVQNTQKKILQQLAKHEVHYNKLLNKMADYSVITAGTNREVAVEERFPPLKTVQELFQLEDNLKNPEFRSKYLKNISTLCSLGIGAKGYNICYKVIDYFFSRELLTLVSWSGNSRDRNEKVAFKFFVQIRQMFFSIIHNADPTISQLETDNFIKVIIKNSKQRLNATLKPVSVSTPKNRKTRSNKTKSQNDPAESNKEPTADAKSHSDAAESNIESNANDNSENDAAESNIEPSPDDKSENETQSPLEM